MKLSKAWLADFIALEDIGAEELEDLLTTKVAEVDAVSQLGVPLGHAVIAEVLAVKPHPNADKLRLATVATGEEQLEVVCGAPNVREGLKAVYLPLGSKFHAEGDLIEISARKIRGVLSEGMLAAEDELGVGSAHEGIIELAADAQVGALAATVLGEVDTIFEIDNKSLTHRPDLWGHFGFARELAAILKRPLKLNPDEYADDNDVAKKRLAALGKGKARFAIRVEPGCGCNRLTTIEIDNVSTAPSPRWMRRRLYTVGAGVRNLLVDLSNYVMHDIGQPNHAYDPLHLRGTTIAARKAKAGEKFTALDGETYELTAEDIAIADEEGVVALGGVMGGLHSSVHDDTCALVVESANFDPVQIRKSAKRHNLRTDASNRFEKHQSPYSAPTALWRFVQLIQQAQPDAQVTSSVSDSFPRRPEVVAVPFSYERIRARLGRDLKDVELEEILTGLGFKVTSKKNQAEALVPHYRATRDVRIEQDLDEEIGRIAGYATIPEEAPMIPSAAPYGNKLRDVEHELRDCLVGAGFSEVYCYSFVSAEWSETLGYDKQELIRIKNPVSAEEDCLRTSAIPSMVEAAIKNARNFSQFGLFEIGRSYHATAKNGDKRSVPVTEGRKLSLAYLSGLSEQQAGAVGVPAVTQGADFYAVITLVKRLLSLFTTEELVVDAEVAAASAWSERFWMHPYRKAVLRVGDEEIGVVAGVRSGAFEGAPAGLVLAELDIEQLIAVSTERLFEPISRFPDSYFELSVVMPKDKAYRSLETLLFGSKHHELFKRLQVLSLYEGAPLGDGEKSISVRFSLAHPERTLSAEELESVQGELISLVEKSEFSLRS